VLFLRFVYAASKHALLTLPLEQLAQNENIMCGRLFWPDVYQLLIRGLPLFAEQFGPDSQEAMPIV